MIIRTLFDCIKRDAYWSVSVWPFTYNNLKDYLCRYYERHNLLVALNDSFWPDGVHFPTRKQIGVKMSPCRQLGIVDPSAREDFFDRCGSESIVDLKVCAISDSVSLSREVTLHQKNEFMSPTSVAAFWRYSAAWIHRNDESNAWFDTRPNQRHLMGVVDQLLRLYCSNVQRGLVRALSNRLENISNKHYLWVEWNGDQCAIETLDSSKMVKDLDWCRCTRPPAVASAIVADRGQTFK